MEYRNVQELFPGIGCAWTNATGKTAAEYYGVADRESNTPVNRDTVFPACSVSKFITAICVMKLHEQGVIDIDYGRKDLCPNSPSKRYETVGSH